VAKGDATREHILRQAAAVFNRLGYAGASVSDLEEATGLRTGGIYRHFPGGKEALAVEAFRYATERVDERLAAAAATPGSAMTRLRALVDTYAAYAASPPVPGGCPVMNAAIEHDAGGSGALRSQARRAMDRWRALVRDVVADGQAGGELRDDVPPEAVATMIVATMEGAIMLAELYHDGEPLAHAAGQTVAYLESAVRR
jgi:TetR/AcrR family transcriptional regulator, transcriptional repressor for nem operon